MLVQMQQIYRELTERRDQFLAKIGQLIGRDLVVGAVDGLVGGGEGQDTGQTLGQCGRCG